MARTSSPRGNGDRGAPEQDGMAGAIRADRADSSARAGRRCIEFLSPGSRSLAGRTKKRLRYNGRTYMHPVTQREREPEPVIEEFVELSSHSRLPRLDLGVDWGSPWVQFRSSWRNFFDGSLKAPSPSDLPADSDLRVEWIEGKAPVKALRGSAILWHVALIGLLFLPILAFSREQTTGSSRCLELSFTWAPIRRTCHRFSMPCRAPTPTPSRRSCSLFRKRGPDAFHPRQTILSQPVRVISPAANTHTTRCPVRLRRKLKHPCQISWNGRRPPAPPQTAVALWTTAAAAPQRQHRSTDDLTAPEIANQEKKRWGSLNIAEIPPYN